MVPEVSPLCAVAGSLDAFRSLSVGLQTVDSVHRVELSVTEDLQVTNVIPKWQGQIVGHRLAALFTAVVITNTATPVTAQSGYPPRCPRRRSRLKALPRRPTNVAEQRPDVVHDLERRLLAYAKQQKPSLWINAQTAFVGSQGRTIIDPDFDIDDGGLPHEKPAISGG